MEEMRTHARGGRERGQASLMMGMMIATFLFFFAFVVNTGMLVHAKINLQNAADLAAYSGAAVQARQLTQISYLNYEMRRAYKKFLYRYYVLGTQSYDCFPRNGAALPAGCQTPWQMTNQGQPTPADLIGVPAVCVPFKRDDNYCRLPKIPELKKIQNVLGDPITQTLNKFYDDLNAAKEDMCNSAGTTNVRLLNLWLWNTDPELTALKSQVGQIGSNGSAADNNLRDSLTVLSTLGAGIGLIPRELLLASRVKTLASYVDTPAQNVTRADVDRLADPNHRSPEPQAVERTIQAFRSAFYTLGSGAFSADSIQLSEVLPSHLIKLDPIQKQFDAWAVYLQPASTAPNNPNPGARGQCVAQLIFDGPNAGPLTLGFSKDPNVLTYYAVKLQAKAKLLFNPFGGEITLSAYAAAKPFGSRIGPKADLPGVSDWTYSGAPRNYSPPIGEARTQRSLIPNLPIRPGDSAQAGHGWDTVDWLYNAYQMLDPSGANFSPGTQITSQMLAIALHRAMAPTKNEPLYYNIPYDGDDPMIRNFDSEKVMAIWAPVMPLSSAGGASSQLDTELGNLFGSSFNQGNAVTTAQSNLFGILKQNVGTYLDRLKAGKGEPLDLLAGYGNSGAEGYNVVRITDPTQQRPWGAAMNLQGGYFALTGKEIRTSWSDVPNAFSSSGRNGYSVKFVSFQSLNSGVSNSIGSSSADGIEDDLPYLQH